MIQSFRKINGFEKLLEETELEKTSTSIEIQLKEYFCGHNVNQNSWGEEFI